MENVVEFLLEKAKEERSTCAHRCSRQADFKAKGMEFAAGAVDGRIDRIKDALARTKVAADVDPLDGQMQDEQKYLDGMVNGLLKALDILGIEMEES